MTPYLTAFEHQAVDVQSVGTPTALDLSEADSLDRIGQRLRGFCERRYRSVRLANFCGLVNIGRRLLEILPKIDDARPPDECRGLLLHLLRRSERTAAFHHLSAGQTLRAAPLIEVFVAAFFDSVRDLLRGGLMRQYREHQEDLQVVRGRIDAGRQFSVLANRQDIVACEFDELTADNPWNQFIKAGLRAVRPWIASVELRRRWTDLMIALDEVVDIDLPATAYDRLSIDRKAQRCVSAAEWARRILALQSPALRAGAEDAPGLLFDINHLWESAVAAELRRRLAGTEFHLQTQVTGHHLATIAGTERPAVPLRPDIVVSRAGRPVAIADTKWKRLDVGRGGIVCPSADDVYQMEAYAAAFECEQLMLLYPWHRGLTAGRDTVLNLPARSGAQPRLSVVVVDVFSGTFAPVLGAGALADIGMPRS